MRQADMSMSREVIIFERRSPISKLSVGMRARASRQWDYLELSESPPLLKMSRLFWINLYTFDVVPEVEIYLWDSVVLVFIHSVELLEHRKKAQPLSWDENRWKGSPQTPNDVAKLPVGAKALLQRNTSSVREQMYRLTLMVVIAGETQMLTGMKDRAKFLEAECVIKAYQDVLVSRLQLGEEMYEVRHQKIRETARCEHCQTNAGRMKMCGKCGVALYCSVACQRRGWTRHKPACGRTARFVSTQRSEVMMQVLHDVHLYFGCFK